MLLHLTPSLPPKALPPDPSLFSSFSSPPLPQTLNPKSSKLLVRCCSADALPKSAIQRIAQKLRGLGFAEDDHTAKPEPAHASAGEIFLPLPSQLPRHRVGHTLNSTPETEKQKVPTLAELTLPPEELRRLRRIGIGLSKKLKIGKAGVTEGIVNGIHERWIRSEVVKIECNDFAKTNSKRTHDLLERKTGGLVVWRTGSKIVLYRGANYKYPYFLTDSVSKSGSLRNTLADSEIDDEQNDMGNSLSVVDGVEPDGQSPTRKLVQPALVQGVGIQNRVRFQLPSEAELTEEVDLAQNWSPRKQTHIQLFPPWPNF